jgi:hypothetical protein
MAETGAKTPIPHPLQLMTARMLAFSWQVMLPSFGLTLIYVNFHFIAKYFASSNKFADFGSEWSITLRPNIGAKYAEIGMMLILDAIVVGIVMLIAVLLYIIVLIATDRCTLYQAFGVGTIGGIVSLINPFLGGATILDYFARC